MKLHQKPDLKCIKEIMYGAAIEKNKAIVQRMIKYRSNLDIPEREVTYHKLQGLLDGAAQSGSMEFYDYALEKAKSTNVKIGMSVYYAIVHENLGLVRHVLERRIENTLDEYDDYEMYFNIVFDDFKT
ncbi:hypothetical protein BB558_005904 [Smittium angustum]|nr:hypothetical protein BB558_005904 [Smittium angustum]